MKKDLYRVLEREFLAKKEEFASRQEHYNWLRNYAKEAEWIYNTYKDKPAEIKDKESQQKFIQYSLYKKYESSLALTEIFHARVRAACRIAFLIRSLEKEKYPLEKDEQIQKESSNILGRPVEIKKIQDLQIAFAIAKGEAKEMMTTLGPLLEYGFLHTYQRKKLYFEEFKPLAKKESKLKALSEGLVGTVKTAQEAFEKEIAEEPETRAMLYAQVRDYLRDFQTLQKALESPYALAEIEKISRETDKDLLSHLYAKTEKEEKTIEKYESKEEIRKDLNQISKELDELWQQDMVRYLEYQSYLKRLVEQDQFGSPILEIPSMVKLMNKVAIDEKRQTETPIAAVLIGPPGTGKSMCLEHYLAVHPEHRKKEPPVVIDMSQETTEFYLLGGEQIDVGDKASTVRMLADLINQRKELSKKIVTPGISQNEKEALKSELENSESKILDIIYCAIGHHVELKKSLEKIEKETVDEVAQNGKKELLDEAEKQIANKKITEEISKIVEKAMNNWMALELGKIMYGNGWRKGILLKAIEEGRDIIINEYNNFRIAPDALRQLWQTAYKGKWFGPPGREYPILSRIYFTANEGSSAEAFFNDTAAVSAAFQSRLLPPIEVKLPPIEEELLIAQAKLSDTRGKFLLDENLTARLYATKALKDYQFDLQYNEKEVITYLLKDILPRLRVLTEKAPKEVPSLDLRHVNRFCRELVDRFDREKNPVSVEEAFVKHFIAPFYRNLQAEEVLNSSGIIIEMYKNGLLHDRRADSWIKNVVDKTMAAKLGKQLDYGTEEARRNVQTAIEEELQQYDTELIQNLERMEETNWPEVLKRAKKKKKILIINPYLEKKIMPASFSRESPRPETRNF